MNDDNDKHMDKDEDVENDCHMSSNYLPSFFEDQAHRNSFHKDIILPNLRTCASFAVTGVTRFTRCKGQWHSCRAISRDKRVVK